MIIKALGGCAPPRRYLRWSFKEHVGHRRGNALYDRWLLILNGRSHIFNGDQRARRRFGNHASPAAFQLHLRSVVADGRLRGRGARDGGLSGPPAEIARDHRAIGKLCNAYRVAHGVGGKAVRHHRRAACRSAGAPSASCSAPTPDAPSAAGNTHIDVLRDPLRRRLALIGGLGLTGRRRLLGWLLGLGFRSGLPRHLV